MRLTLVPVLRSTVRARVPVLRVRYRYMRTMQSTRVRYARVRVPVPAFADHPVFAVFSISPEYGTCTAVRYYRYLKNHRELQYTLCQPMPTDAPSCQIMLNSVHYAGRCWRGALCRKIMLASGRDPKFARVAFRAPSQHKQKVSSSDARMTFIMHCLVVMATGQSLSSTN